MRRSLDADGRAPVHWAAYKGFADTLRLLLVAGADLERGDREGCTPLHWAAIRGNGEAVTLLLRARLSGLCPSGFDLLLCRRTAGAGSCGVELLLCHTASMAAAHPDICCECDSLKAADTHVSSGITMSASTPRLHSGCEGAGGRRTSAGCDGPDRLHAGAAGG